MTAPSFVTILTPVYNGAAYLAECIESVLGQTYPHWEYVIVDNASSDATPTIARAYAARDPRVRVRRNLHTVPVIDNHNIAVQAMSPCSRWCKIVSADDTLFPECLERMLAVADRFPSVGLISAYQLQGHRLTLGGLPYPSLVTPGRAVARASLLGHLSVFGAPTAHMIRADLVRARVPFYDPMNLHADEAACYEVLRTADLGFVHQILSCARMHPESITFSVARRLNTYLLGHLRILTTYGPVYFRPCEYERVLEERLDAYYKFLVRALLSPQRREIWRYHSEGLRQIGLTVSPRRLVRAALQQAGRVALSPGGELRKILRLAHASDDVDAGAWRQWWAPTGFEPIKNVPISDKHAA